MKVRITFEVNDDDRLLIGTASDDEGRLRPATHEELVSSIDAMYEEFMVPKRAAFEIFRKEFIAGIKW